MTLSLPSQEKKGIESPFPWELLRAEVWGFLPPFVPPEWCHGDKGRRMLQDTRSLSLWSSKHLELWRGGRLEERPQLLGWELCPGRNSGFLVLWREV